MPPIDSSAECKNLSIALAVLSLGSLMIVCINPAAKFQTENHLIKLFLDMPKYSENNWKNREDTL